MHGTPTYAFPPLSPHTLVVEVGAPLTRLILALHHGGVGDLTPTHTEAGVTKPLALGTAEPVHGGVVGIQHHTLCVKVLPILTGGVGAFY